MCKSNAMTCAHVNLVTTQTYRDEDRPHGSSAVSKDNVLCWLCLNEDAARWKVMGSKKLQYISAPLRPQGYTVFDFLPWLTALIPAVPQYFTWLTWLGFHSSIACCCSVLSWMAEQSCILFFFLSSGKIYQKMRGRGNATDPTECFPKMSGGLVGILKHK